MTTWALPAAAFGLLICFAGGPPTRVVVQGNAACALLTQGEVERALGAKVTGLTSGPADVPAGVTLCTGTIPGATISIRLMSQATQDTLDARKKLVDLATQMGAHVDVSTNGPISCQAITPPAALAASIGFGTWCSASKSPKLAVIEVETKTQALMVPVGVLRSLAEKILPRL